jgi:hypothetical protein
VSVVELSDEETVAILAETFTERLSDIGDKTRQVAVLKRLHTLLDSTSPQHYIYETVEGCDELQVIRVGSDQRIFCRLVMGIPHGNEHYNVLFVFYVDPHQYRPQQLSRFDAAAEHGSTRSRRSTPSMLSTTISTRRMPSQQRKSKKGLTTWMDEQGPVL